MTFRWALSAAMISVWCGALVAASGAPDRDRVVIIGPGLFTTWFDQMPPDEVVRRLSRMGTLDSRRHMSSEMKTLPSLTEVQCVELGDTGQPATLPDGTVKLRTAWVWNFHWDKAHQQAIKDGVPVLVVLEPGHKTGTTSTGKASYAPAEFVSKCRGSSCEEWVKAHAYRGGVAGAAKHEAVIKATIDAASQMGGSLVINGHSQFGPNLVSTLARYPEMAETMRGARIQLINPAFGAPLMKAAAHSPLALAPALQKKLDMPSVAQLTEADSFSPVGYGLQPSDFKGSHYLQFVQTVAPQVGALARQHGIQWMIYDSQDRLVDPRVSRRMAESLGAEQIDTKQACFRTEVLGTGNSGIFRGGNMAGDSMHPVAPESQLGHSPRGGENDYKIMNRLFIDAWRRTGSNVPRRDAGNTNGEAGVSMKMAVPHSSLTDDSTGQLDRKRSALLERRPKRRALSWPAGKRR